ncbi:alpha/beta fold hydrolase [Sessilibacter sp. MAH4]
MTWVWLRGLARETGHWGGLPKQAEKLLGEPVVTIDLPGFGRFSDRDAPVKTRKVVEFLIEQTQNLTQIHVLGVSLGGLIALEWASVDQRIVSVTAVNSSNRLCSIHHRLNFSKALKLLAAFVTTDRASIRESKILSVVSNQENKVRRVHDLWSEIARRRPVAIKQVLRQLFMAATAPIVNPKLLQQCRVTFITSEHDQLVSSRCSHILASFYSANLLVHPTAGHDLPLDDPQWLLMQLPIVQSHTESAQPKASDV